MRIRDLNGEDIEFCASLAVDSPLKPVYGFTQQGWETKLKEALQAEQNLLFLAEDEGKIAGFAWVHAKGAFLAAPYLRFITVSAEFRGRGVGSLLLDEFEKRTSQVGKDYFLLVSDFNSAAQKLYEKHGYEVIGELADFSVKGVSEILMSKKHGNK